MIKYLRSSTCVQVPAFKWSGDQVQASGQVIRSGDQVPAEGRRRERAVGGQDEPHDAPRGGVRLQPAGVIAM